MIIGSSKATVLSLFCSRHSLHAWSPERHHPLLADYTLRTSQRDLGSGEITPPIAAQRAGLSDSY